MSSVFIIDDNFTNEDFMVVLSLKNTKKLKIPNGSHALLSVKGSKKVVCRVYEGFCVDSHILINRLIRYNLGALLGDAVTLKPLPNITLATQVWLALEQKEIRQDILQDLITKYQFSKMQYTLHEGNNIVLRGGNVMLTLVVTKILPQSYGITNPTTRYQLHTLQQPQNELRSLNDLSYDDIGGQKAALNDLRKFECLMKCPSFFKAFNPEPARIILHGPEGLGKLLMAKAFAKETNAHFSLIDYEILKSKYNKENNVIDSISIIQEKFDEAIENVPSIICINDLHLMTPVLLKTRLQKDVATGLIKSVEKLKCNPNIILIGITTATRKMHHTVLPLFSQSRNAAEIAFSIPDSSRRLEILKICTKNMTLEGDFDINQISAETNNYTGAQLAQLCEIAYRLSMRKQQKETITADFRSSLVKMNAIRTREVSGISS